MRFFPEIHGCFVSKPIFSKNEFFSPFFGKKDMNVEFVSEKNMSDLILTDPSAQALFSAEKSTILAQKFH
jgi:hypothetical protein